MVKKDWERHKQREMKALAEKQCGRSPKTEKRVAEETEKRVRKALENQMAEEIERKFGWRLWSARTTINIM